MNAEVEATWKRYAVVWWFGVLQATIAILILSVAPVKNEGWTLLLAGFWTVYLIGMAYEVSDYFETRRGYIRFRADEKGA